MGYSIRHFAFHIFFIEMTRLKMALKNVSYILAVHNKSVHGEARAQLAF